MPRKDKVIHISNLPSTFRGNITRNGRFIQNGIPPLGGAYDKVAKSTGLIRLGNEFLYNGINNLVSKDNREKLMNNTAGRLINYVKDFNKESFPNDDELGPTFPFNIIQTPRSNGKKLPQKQYAVGGKIPNVVAGGIAQSLGNNFFYMNGRKHGQGGIDIGPSDKTGIEVEDGEVVETNGNELKVYSAQPIINGVSPAKLIMSGANPNKVFKAQEDFKDRNGINDDGSKATYGKEKENEGLFTKIDDYANTAEKVLAIPNRSISRTSVYPIDKSARGETVTGNEYTFKNGRWRKNDKVDNNTTVRDIDNGNRRPQYYAERELPLFNDGPVITSGLVRAGWSHGNNKKYNVDNINIPNIPNVNIPKSKGQTPRRGQSKQNQSIQSIQVNTPPVAVYNRNLPKVEASIPTTLPVSTRNPIQGTISSDGKWQGKFKNITTADWIGLGSNIAGSLASYFSSRSALNKMRSPSQPMLISANKLKTKYNINPQLDRIREDKFASYRDIDSNTASSRVGLARKQRVRDAVGQAVNELYGNKENIETNLINQDRRNQQSVRQFNAQQYNQYIDRKAAFDNGIREAKVTNINNLFSGINAGIQDMISRYENRKALNNTIGAMRASAPNVDDRIMRDAGVDYDEFIIRKRRKLGGKQSCR